MEGRSLPLRHQVRTNSVYVRTPGQAQQQAHTHQEPHAGTWSYASKLKTHIDPYQSMEMQMDMQYPGLLPQAYSSVAAPFAMVMPNHVHDMIGGYSIQHHPYGAAVAGLPPGGIKRRKKDGVRKGKWTPEEEEYTSKIIHLFNTGLLTLPEGTTLRAYLAEKLGCDPMRITKKFTGAACLGKRVYHSCERNPATIEQIEKAQSELAELERIFKSRVEQVNKEKKASAIEFDSRMMHSGNVVSSPAIDAMVMQNRTLAASWQAAYSGAPGPPFVGPPIYRNGYEHQMQNVAHIAPLSSQATHPYMIGAPPQVYQVRHTAHTHYGIASDGSTVAYGPMHNRAMSTPNGYVPTTMVATTAPSNDSLDARTHQYSGRVDRPIAPAYQWERPESIRGNSHIMHPRREDPPDDNAHSSHALYQSRAQMASQEDQLASGLLMGFIEQAHRVTSKQDLAEFFQNGTKKTSAELEAVGRKRPRHDMSKGSEGKDDWVKRSSSDYYSGTQQKYQFSGDAYKQPPGGTVGSRTMDSGDEGQDEQWVNSSNSSNASGDSGEGEQQYVSQSMVLADRPSGLRDSTQQVPVAAERLAERLKMQSMSASNKVHASKVARWNSKRSYRPPSEVSHTTMESEEGKSSINGNGSNGSSHGSNEESEEFEPDEKTGTLIPLSDRIHCL